eukprot:1051054-Heterocapsa_arctica.AAC.1
MIPGRGIMSKRPAPLFYRGGAVARLSPHTQMGYVPFRPAHVCLPGGADRRKRDTERGSAERDGLSSVPSPRPRMAQGLYEGLGSQPLGLDCTADGE